MRFRLLLSLVLLASPPVVSAEPYESIQARKPDLFDDVTGFRTSRYLAPIPDDIPGGARPLPVAGIKSAIDAGAVLVDVHGLSNTRYDELDGAWVTSGEHLSIPGAIWLPEVGRGAVSSEIGRFLRIRLEEATGGDLTRPLIVFCRADCWMSWNAARRVAALGYENVHWFPLGVEGWEEAGGTLTALTPTPVPVE